MAKTIYVLNGPRLDLLGAREPAAHSHAMRSDVDKLCIETALHHGLCADCLHPTCEDELIDCIYEARAKNAAGIVLNAEGCCSNSIALQTALTAARIPAVEVVDAHDNIRHPSFAAQIVLASLCGFGIDGYRLAITGLAARIGARAAV